MRKIEFEWWHYHEIKMREEDAYLSLYADDMGQLGYTLQETSFQAISLEDEGKVFACAGVGQAGPTVAEAWLYTDERLKKHLRRGSTLLMSEMRAACAEMGAKRIQIHVHQDFETSHRWVQWVGFMPEGYQPFYYPDGKAALVYVMYPHIPRDKWMDLYVRKEE